VLGVFGGVGVEQLTDSPDYFLRSRILGTQRPDEHRTDECNNRGGTISTVWFKNNWPIKLEFCMTQFI